MASVPGVSGVSGVPGVPGVAPGGLPVARRLRRVARRRVVGGVCQGLAEHLRVDVLWVRVAFVGLTFASGAGLLAYALFWFLTPLEAVEAVDESDGLDEGHDSDGQELGQLLALAALAIGAALALDSLGVGLGAAAQVPLALGALGVVLLWRQADDAQRARWWAATGTGPSRSSTRRWGLLRAGAGLALVVAGVLLFVTNRSSGQDVLPVLLGGSALAAGLALTTAPWWMRMARELAAERAARIREQERAEVAAMVHDSVLHTLTLIQRHVDDPREVARLARAQERSLRGWLYQPAADPDATLRAAVERLAAEVEDAHGSPVEVVVVGDCALDDRLRALLLATREALVNAAKYAGSTVPGSISVFVEVEPEVVTAFVRDRGPGFDVDGVPEDRLGVRQSIIGRMGRNGGRAVVRSAPGEGTEVELEAPRRAPAATPAGRQEGRHETQRGGQQG